MSDDRKRNDLRRKFDYKVFEVTWGASLMEEKLESLANEGWHLKDMYYCGSTFQVIMERPFDVYNYINDKQDEEDAPADHQV